MKKIEQTLNEFYDSLKRIDLKNKNILITAELKIRLVKRALNQFQHIISREGFKSKKEEIYFFKIIKPNVLSHLIFNVKLYGIETKKPHRSKTAQVKFFKRFIDKLQLYFNDNLEFYQYYKKQETYLDKEYFLQGNGHFRLHPDTFILFSNEKFSSSHDSTLATIIAYEMLITYFKKEIGNLKNNSNTMKASKNTMRSKLKLTASKSDIIELVYALHVSGSINYGNSNINEIIKFIEELLDIKLGDPYRAFLSIRLRKVNRSKFLDHLKDSLNDYMDKLDE